MLTDNVAASLYSDLEGELRILFRRASAVTSATARRVHPDLDASAYPLLAHIAEHPGVRGSELAAHVGVGRGTISRQLARLQDLGLVTRMADPEDSRGQMLTLTDDGASRFEEARNGRVAAIGAIMQDWSPADVSTLTNLLHRYSADVARWRESR
jgi:DNA-binding MarR family transcriptional regulator